MAIRTTSSPIAWRRQRTTATATGAAVVFLRDESSIPAQDRVGGDDTSHSAQDPSPELLPADGEPTPLSVGQAERTAAQLFREGLDSPHGDSRLDPLGGGSANRRQ